MARNSVQAVNRANVKMSRTEEGREFRRLPPKHDSSVPYISQREIEVLSCVAQGETQRQIAAKLGISLYTVKVHYQNLRAHLGAKHLAHAVHLAHERHLF